MNKPAISANLAVIPAPAISDATQHAHGTCTCTVHMAGHTPGKWTHKRRALLIPPKTSYICEVGHDWHVVSDIPRDGWNHSEQDAALIAAAPDLLNQVTMLKSTLNGAVTDIERLRADRDAMRAALQRLDNAVNEPSLGIDLIEASDQARAALGRAAL